MRNYIMYFYIYLFTLYSLLFIFLFNNISLIQLIELLGDIYSICLMNVHWWFR